MNCIKSEPLVISGFGAPPDNTSSNMKWISIKDGLPEYDLYVLVMGDAISEDGDRDKCISFANRCKCKAYHCIDHWEFLTNCDDARGNAVRGNGFETLCEANITHWMSLPKFP